MGFQKWFEEYGNELFTAFPKAVEGKAVMKGETFAEWVVAEYDCYLASCEVGEEYEVPYTGLAD